LEAVVLEREAISLAASAAAADPAQVLDKLNSPEWLALVDELLVGHACEVVEPPPERLVLAAVPVEKLRQEPGRVLLPGPVERVRGQARRQGRDELGDSLLPLAEVPGSGGFGLGGR